MQISIKQRIRVKNITKVTKVTPSHRFANSLVLSPYFLKDQYFCFIEADTTNPSCGNFIICAEGFDLPL